MGDVRGFKVPVQCVFGVHVVQGEEELHEPSHDGVLGQRLAFGPGEERREVAALAVRHDDAQTRVAAR